MSEHTHLDNIAYFATNRVQVLEDVRQALAAGNSKLALRLSHKYLPSGDPALLDLNRQAKSAYAAVSAAAQEARSSRTAAARSQRESAARELAAQQARFSYFTIRANMHAMTDVQFDEYAESLEGAKVSWGGWVEEVEKKGLVGYECWVDMDSPSEMISVQDVRFSVSKDVARALSKDARVQFSGTIENVQNVMGVCMVAMKHVSIQGL